MAYISAEHAKEIRNNLKQAFPQFKFSVRCHRASSLEVSILSGPVRFTNEDYHQINHYHLHRYDNSPILESMIKIINKENWNKSDRASDHFDVGFWLEIQQGQYNKPYQLNGVAQ